MMNFIQENEWAVCGTRKCPAAPPLFLGGASPGLALAQACSGSAVSCSPCLAQPGPQDRCGPGLVTLSAHVSVSAPILVGTLTPSLPFVRPDGGSSLGALDRQRTT